MTADSKNSIQNVDLLDISQIAEQLESGQITRQQADRQMQDRINLMSNNTIQNINSKQQSSKYRAVFKAFGNHIFKRSIIILTFLAAIFIFDYLSKI